MSQHTDDPYQIAQREIERLFRDLIYQRASTILRDPEAARYVWGIGFHWYEPWSGGDPMYDNVKLTHDTFPDKPLIFTEGCKDAFDRDKVDDWKLGEMYGRQMIHDFNNGTVAWCDWNILLDETGGPNHVNNVCFAPIHADTRRRGITVEQVDEAVDRARQARRREHRNDNPPPSPE